MKRLDRWASRILTGIDHPGSWLAAGLTVTGLAACWLLAFRSDSEIAVSRHWFYVPVVFAAVRFGLRGAVATGVAAGVLAGPLAGGLATLAADARIWGTRAGFFVGIGVVVAALVAMVRRSLARDLEVAQREAELAGQQATFIQTISHEFRTPLTVLRGGILTLDRQQEHIEPALRPLVASLLRAERRLDEMVSVVLATVEAADASRRLDAEPVRLRELTVDVVASLDRRHGSGRVRHDIPAQALIVTVPAYLRLILHAVIDNALRFSPADRLVVVTTTPGADEMVITVRDHGDGMDETFQQVAFNPFTQADGSSQRKHGGLGLGLFTARRLAERLGGTITATPADPGLVVTISLPQRRGTDDDGSRRTRAVPILPALHETASRQA